MKLVYARWRCSQCGKENRARLLTKVWPPQICVSCRYDTGFSLPGRSAALDRPGTFGGITIESRTTGGDQCKAKKETKR